MIKNVIFDIGNVLAKFRWQKLFKELGFEGEVFDHVADATVRGPWCGRNTTEAVCQMRRSGSAAVPWLRNILLRLWRFLKMLKIYVRNTIMPELDLFLKGSRLQDLSFIQLWSDQF